MQPPSPLRRRAREILFIALGLIYLPLRALLPDVPTNTNAVRHVIAKPKPPIVCTNLQLSWKPYTNAFFEVIGSTNLEFTNWYHVANAPLWTTNITLPVRYPQEFFRVQTIYVVGVE